MTTANKSDKDRVIIFDTTLRDGEQCPGATMTFEEKLEIAEMLDDMGVDVIEAGFPITSEGDFQAVSEIARRSKNSVIAGLSRANPKDIDRCAEAVKFARRGRVHTVIATSPLHMRVKLNMTPEQVIDLSIANVTRARNQIDDVEWSAEDATRSEMDYLCRIVEAVHEIAKRSRNSVICGLSRAGAKDIDRCAEAIRPARQGRIHTFLSTSPVHMKYKLQLDAAQVYDLVVSSVTRARNHTDNVEWSSEDGTST